MADQAKKVKGVVDIVFLIDVTGSMEPCITALTQNIGTFIDYLTSTDPNNQCPVKNWRAKAVGYRDFEDRSIEPFVDNPFVEQDATALKAQLALLRADGGGDEPESLLEALYKVANMEQTDKDANTSDPYKWRYRSDAARVVIVFTDATFKEPMVEPAGGTIEDVKHVCHANRIILSLFAPDMECHDRLSEIDKSEYEAIPYDKSDNDGAVQALKDYTTDQANFKRTLEQLAKSVSKSAETVTL